MKNENNDAGIRLYDSNSTPRHHIYNRNGADDILRITPSASLSYQGGITINQSGQVGINNTYPARALDVQGNVRAQNFEYQSPKTSYLSLGPSAFQRSHLDVWDTGWRISNGSNIQDLHLRASVNVPHGSTITKVKAWFRDSSIYVAQVYLRKFTYDPDELENVTFMSSLTTTWNFDYPHMRSIESTDIAEPVIDNAHAAYFLTVTLHDLEPDDGGVTFYGVIIEYTTDGV